MITQISFKCTTQQGPEMDPQSSFGKGTLLPSASKGVVDKVIWESSFWSCGNW